MNGIGHTAVWLRLAGISAGLCVVLVLTACGAARPLPPEQRHTASSSMQPLRAPESYRVTRGDTLYSIAFRYGLDWREVAAWNELRAPYTIRVDHWIRLKPPPKMQKATVFAGKPRVRETGSTVSQPGVPAEPASESSANTAESGPGRSIAAPGTPAAVTRSAEKPAVNVPPKKPASPVTAKVPAATTSLPGRSVAGVDWHWPTVGSLARQFSNGDSRKGILIAGRLGQPVRAAASGNVVYSGNGLIGYGELIIIKHSDSMLSAYAHNRERLVSEGERVSAGQEIATLGRNEREAEVLHFEIRRDGKPDDPLKYLPQR
ncbi:MAG: peptidoglycan DD-metalloendopeptidase family protein [Wenzhouxiangellaceae bacterium]|nr:peptidoglycan DD-metalloendopeptidase family protein [Wenzhouxiangellaceae bacterium]